MIPKLWKSITTWFEHGDLVPLLVVVSAVHYAAVLQKYDYWPVAIAIGLLVDLGHFRTVRAAVRYAGDNWRQIAVRWFAVVVMTAVSLAYHQRYYGDWWLSAPLPLLIAFLAWQQHVDSRIGVRDKSVTVATDDKHSAPRMTNDMPVAKPAKPLTAAQQYAVANGVSQRTAYRHLAEAKPGGNGKENE